ncbi:MAG: hypothetical protein AAF623_16455, partial [Planctomycetota bacterium]
MNLTKTSILFLFICSIFVVTASAQTKPSFQIEANSGLSRVLSMGRVAEDIGLDEMERISLMTSWLVTRGELNKVFTRYADHYGKGLPEDEQEALLTELEDSIKQIRIEEENRLAIVLDESQMQRLKQLQFQYLRRNSSMMGGLREFLELTEEQIKECQKIGQEMKKTMVEMRKDSIEVGLARVEIIEHLQEIRENTEEKLMEVLTP